MRLRGCDNSIGVIMADLLELIICFSIPLPPQEPRRCNYFNYLDTYFLPTTIVLYTLQLRHLHSNNMTWYQCQWRNGKSSQTILLSSPSCCRIWSPGHDAVILCIVYGHYFTCNNQIYLLIVQYLYLYAFPT